ncbi:type II secretion system protein N [soil metagenome]
MELTLDPWRARLLRRLPRRFPYRWIEVALIVVLAVQCARFVWIAFAPLGPVGAWKGAPAAPLTNNGNVLKTFDPFFRMSASSGNSVVTSLPLKLFGVRVDQASGRGSAIIATADGVQQSFAVGDEVMPGIRLKSVAQDNVTLDRGGTVEQLFLDQSVPAPVAQPGVTAANDPLGAQPSVANPPGVAALRTGIAFAPRMEKGVVTGFLVTPRGAGEVFRAAGLLPGDIVIEINGQKLNSVEGAASSIANIPPGTLVRFAVQRGGRVTVISAKVGQ